MADLPRQTENGTPPMYECAKPIDAPKVGHFSLERHESKGEGISKLTYCDRCAEQQKEQMARADGASVLPDCAPYRLHQ